MTSLGCGHFKVTEEGGRTDHWTWGGQGTQDVKVMKNGDRNRGEREENALGVPVSNKWVTGRLLMTATKCEKSYRVWGIAVVCIGWGGERVRKSPWESRKSASLSPGSGICGQWEKKHNPLLSAMGKITSSGPKGFQLRHQMNRMFKAEDKDLKEFWKIWWNRWMLGQIIIIGSDINNSTNIINSLCPHSHSH